MSTPVDAPPAQRLPTPEQEAAISISGSDVLLEAGAGTGKTGVMVDRYCRLVCEEGVAPDAILAFTFTDKAAAELRQRIRAELALRASGSERARELLGQIGAAWITTIHGFCNRLLAGHPVAAGIDPGFRVLDAAEAERAAREAFDEALQDLLSGGEDTAADLVATYEIDGLRAIVTGVHAELRSRGVADPRLPEQPQPDVEGSLREAASAAVETLAELKEDDARRELLERAAKRLSAAGSPSVEGLCALRTGSKARALTAYNEAIEAAIARSAEAGEGGEAYRQIARLLELFTARFAAAKERRSGIDFEDLQILAAALLERTEAGEAYRSRFRHLMVDEFQDTNRLQLRLIEALRGPGSELIAVGDELQSIYGFRHADLDVFREQRESIRARAQGRSMQLSGNFRSRPELIGAVNALGRALFGDSYHPLRVGAAREQPAGEGSAVELLLTAREGWGEDGIDLAPAIDDRTPANCLAEARFVAARLRELADAGVERGEMVVLLRAFTHLDAYEDSLERAGLRPYVVGGRGYWSQQQVADVCALLATIANPLDDQALFGALASPACGLAPDTLWLLRAAAGKKRHVWPAVERAVAGGEAELAAPERLEQIPPTELAPLRRFAEAHASLRERAGRLSLAALIEAAVTTTGYDLAVLMRPSGEARFANVRKLIRLAEEFEAREGRDLRGLLDFLASRAETDAEAQAATALEGHDGVRIMTVHNAKGLEFGVVAVPDLARSLLAGTRAPLLALGREEEPRAGMQLRRLGAGAINLYSYADLFEEAKERDAEEGLRLFHVAATRARERLILSGVVRPQANGELKPSTAVIERIVEGLGIDRESDSSVPIPAPEPREGLDASFEPSEMAVRVNLPTPERAAELTRVRRDPSTKHPSGTGTAPLSRPAAPSVPSRPLSYSAIAAFEECPYRFYMERVLDLGDRVRVLSRHPRQNTDSPAEEQGAGRVERAARGAAVHSLLEWSAANGWNEPTAELAGRHATSAGLDDGVAADLLAPVRGWLGSSLLADRVRATGATVRAESPLLLGIAGTVLRGSIDLLVERDGSPPLVIDYKTDRLGGADPAEHVDRYATQRDIYALAVAESRGAEKVEVAYVFLERPDDPVATTVGPTEMEAGRARLTAAIERIERGDFPPASPDRRNWDLCRGCPALGRTCQGPEG
ncbi:MAG TPA: UvrD-helicase domain-containing protein [Solirubrobacterales bacterium]|nr:UvrD-helicase domain-containing protein [Solirubrobacterales bacterium]